MRFHALFLSFSKYVLVLKCLVNFEWERGGESQGMSKEKYFSNSGKLWVTETVL